VFLFYATARSTTKCWCFGFNPGVGGVGGEDVYLL